MVSKNEDRWHINYVALRDYVVKNGHLPSKHQVEDRGLLNWWKYNKKCRKADKLSPEKCRLLDILTECREKGKAGNR